jgi:hypothetical protein
MGFIDINSKAQVWTDPQSVQWQNGRAVGKGAENKGAQTEFNTSRTITSIYTFCRVTYNLKLSRRQNSVKYSRAGSRIRWLNGR